jgi:hypothetical protein
VLEHTPQARDAQAYQEGTLGARARVRLQNSEWFEDLALLAGLDRKGLVRGASVPELEEVFDCVRELGGDELEE